MTDFLLLKHDFPLRFGKYSEAPEVSENGMIYYDTSLNLFRIYENGQWQALSSRDYVRNSVAGFDVKEGCEVATLANLTATYENGTSGVGATLTGSGALPSIDGESLTVGSRVLVIAQTNAAQNGVYTVTTLDPFVLTRAVDFDDSEKVNGGEFFFVKNGNNFGNCAFVCTNSGSLTLGTTAITFTQISGNPRTLHQYYTTGNQIDTSTGRDVIIAGTEKLEVTSVGGLEITGKLTAGETLLSSASITEVMAVASGKFAVNVNGNITKLNNVTVSFPSASSQSNYALANNGSGTLSFTNLAVSNFDDITLTSVSTGEYLKYQASTGDWINSSAQSGLTMTVDFSSASVVTTSYSYTGSVAQTYSYNTQITTYGNLVYWHTFLSNPVSRLHIFNTETKQVSVKIVPVARAFRAVTALSDGRIMLAGGELSQGSPTNTLIFYDPSTGEFTSTTMPNARSRTGFLTLGTKTYIWGGSNDGSVYRKIDIYDNATGTWSTSKGFTDADYPVAGAIQWAFAGTPGFHVNGKIYITEIPYMLPSGPGQVTMYQTIAAYDIANDSWTSLNSWVYYGQIYNGQCSVLQTSNNKIVKVGGSFFPYKAPIEIYDIATNTVSKYDTILPNISALYPGVVAFVYNNYVFVPTFSGTMYVVDPTKATLAATLTNGTPKRRNYGLATMGNKVYMVGGDKSTNGVNSFSELGVTEVQLNGIKESLVASDVIQTDSSGYISQKFIQYQVNLGNNLISSVASPSSSTDLANKAYVDAITLQTLYNRDPDGSDAIITTTTNDGSLIIAGSEKLQVTASNGVSVSQMLAVSSSLSTASLLVGSSAGLQVSSEGSLTKIKGVSYNFPSTSAASADLIMFNDGSGNISWSDPQLAKSAVMTSLSNGDLLVYNGTNFVNISPVTGAGAVSPLKTDSSGVVSESALQYNIDFGTNVLSNIGVPSDSGDVVTKELVDNQTIDPSAGIASLTLQKLYDQDIDVTPNVVITTMSSDGDLEISGTEDFKISATQGFLLASSTSDTRFTKLVYKHGLTLSANQTETALSALTFSSSVYQGCMIEYRIKDTDGKSRVGTLLVSTDGTDTAVSDSFAETSPLGVSWDAELSGSNVEIRYTTDSTTKTMSAAIKYFL